MKFSIHNDLAANIGDPFLPDEGTYPLATNPQFKFEATTSAGYTDVTNFDYWEQYWFLTDKNSKEFRNILIDEANANWGTYADADKKAHIRSNVWPSGTPDAELDALYTDAERDDFQKNTMELLNRNCLCDIRQSTTGSSKKFFDQQNDDTGTITTVEVTTYQTVS